MEVRVEVVVEVSVETFVVVAVAVGTCVVVVVCTVVDVTAFSGAVTKYAATSNTIATTKTSSAVLAFVAPPLFKSGVSP